MFVRDWMSAPAIVISHDIGVKRALQLMDRRNIRRFPVVRDGVLVGIVTKSDLQAVLGRGGPSRRGGGYKVSDIMTQNPTRVDPGETLEAAAQIMLRKKISGLPVVEGERVVGILTESDLFRALCKMLGIGEQGARVVMSVRDNQDVLEVIQRRMSGMSIRSLVTVHDPKRQSWDVTLRVRGRSMAGRKKAN